jgi:hypothetical protein
MTIDAKIVELDALLRQAGALVDELASLVSSVPKRQGPYAKLRERHPNAGKARSGQDDDELRRLFSTGNTVEDLAPLFGRTVNGVRVRLVRLGLLPPEEPHRAA